MSRRLIVDSSCDLPESIISKYNVKVLPAVICVDGRKMMENRDPTHFHFFYSKDQLSYKSIVKNKIHIGYPDDRSYIHNEIGSCFKSGAKEGLVLTVSKRYSDMYKLVDDSVTKIKQDKTNVIRSVNTKTWLSGQGILAMHALALLNNAKYDFNAIARSIEQISTSVKTYVIPGDLRVTRQSSDESKVKSGKPGWLGSRISAATKSRCLLIFSKDSDLILEKVIKNLDQAVGKVVTDFKKCIDPSKTYGGLKSPYVMITYASNSMYELQQLTSVKEMSALCKSIGVRLYVEKMAISGAVQLGMDAVSISFASDKNLDY